jgi:hypothetical protein
MDLLIEKEKTKRKKKLIIWVKKKQKRKKKLFIWIIDVMFIFANSDYYLLLILLGCFREVERKL